jgi:hypothetical protein
MIRRHIFSIAILIFCILLAFAFKSASLIGSTDISKAYLAGATSFLDGDVYPLMQRPPPYSLFLSGLGWITGIKTDSKIPIAQESGDVVRLNVAEELLDPRFLSWVLIFQLMFWLISLIFFQKTLSIFSVPKNYIKTSLIVFLTPSAWLMIGQLWEATLLMLLFSISLYATACLIMCNQNKSNFFWTTLLASLCFSLIGFTRSAYQLLPFLLALGIPIVVFLLTHSKTNLFLQAPIFILLAMIIVGGWSIRNQIVHGFLGEGASLGVSLSTRTANFMEQGINESPEFGEIFVQIRNDRYFLSNSHSPNLWGEDASRYLIQNFDLSYPEANDVLVSYNIATIMKAPLNYMATVFQSFVGFHFPNTPDLPEMLKAPFVMLEFLFILTFFLCLAIWITVQLLQLLNSSLVIIPWTSIDYLILICILIYFYSLIIHCGIDQGSSYQRMSIQYVISLIVVMVPYRFDIFNGSKTKVPNA